ncbi:hypothetical protein F5B20DRAFT_542725 [Whalleya microplaca]|nr:hypothetical protein F5B20DRAFT_542725 [Whalleya microplaca]
MTRFFLGRSLYITTTQLAHPVLVLRRNIGTKRSPDAKPFRPTNGEPFRATDDKRLSEIRKIALGYDVELDESTISLCKTHDLAFPSALYGLKAKLENNPCKLVVLFSPHHCLSRMIFKYLDKNEHPFRKSILDIYIEKTTIPFWYSAWTYGAGAVPCRKAKKKVEFALRDALAAAGYDRYGRRMPTAEPHRIKELYGTLSISIREPLAACNTKFVDVVEQAKAIIAQAEFELARDEHGKWVKPGCRHPYHVKDPFSSGRGRSGLDTNKLERWV